ncbi:MAG: Gfo/Idh/MocA family oxidoreductase [Planctomycetaceae bacterium]|jgi:predicted dehydrogenase|nr:Gfo/Idh/MocA family oxidoreductase [Planctomycetaceae bacterium]MBT6487892.1 Gfo/Idh/MocA family oxidoreductase [Planctomycetaceae bacterium]MBT6493969.1 Gfo/Idh/MocA family oxidoreductase [Planctomycetaceae bacterium]
MPENRREWMLRSAAQLAAIGSGAAGATAIQAEQSPQEVKTATPPDGKAWRVGVISARRHGKPQRINGHTWHFAQYLHPTIDLPTAQKHLDPGNKKYFEEIVRNPSCDFGILPFPDTRISHYYEADPEVAQLFADSFPGVQVATSLEKMVDEVDAVWLGDASGTGDDHYDLIAPALSKGLPTFCDKPIGQTVQGTRKILELARKNKAPLLSGSIFGYEWGLEEVRRLQAKGELGEVQHVVASMMGGYSPEGWFVYGQHPCWSVVAVLGAGVEAVSLYARGNSAHGLVTYPEGPPAEIWYGRPDLYVGNKYNETSVHFQKGVYRYSPAIEGNFWFGHHYEMFNMARAFREMIRTRVEPTSHEAILDVTAMIYAGAKSLKEQSRLVPLAEVLQ